MNILLTGGSGLLGKELQKHIKCRAPLRRLGYDILDAECWKTPCINMNTNKLIKYKLIVHCAAYTDVPKAEEEKKLCYETNVIGTRNLASLGIPMIYISTPYIFDGEKGMYRENDFPNPVNFYGLTKLLGEYESRKTKSVVIRCIFKPRPFSHPSGFTDQFYSALYVDDMAKEIAFAIKLFNNLPPTIHIGGKRLSSYEFARLSRDVTTTTRHNIPTVKFPKDVSLNTEVWEKIKNDNQFRSNRLRSS